MRKRKGVGKGVRKRGRKNERVWVRKRMRERVRGKDVQSTVGDHHIDGYVERGRG